MGLTIGWIYSHLLLVVWMIVRLMTLMRTSLGWLKGGRMMNHTTQMCLQSHTGGAWCLLSLFHFMRYMFLPLFPFNSEALKALQTPSHNGCIIHAHFYWWFVLITFCIQQLNKNNQDAWLELISPKWRSIVFFFFFWPSKWRYLVHSLVVRVYLQTPKMCSIKAKDQEKEVFVIVVFCSIFF